MKIYRYTQLSAGQLRRLCLRQAITLDQVMPVVVEILRQVKTGGDPAVRSLTEKFDRVRITDLAVGQAAIDRASSQIAPAVRRAFRQAARNIEKFHRAQLTGRQTVVTMPGVTCFSEMRPIEKVGLYVPGGTAVLPSTVLMLGIPARLAGCREIVLTTPPRQDGSVHPIILFAAQLCGIKKVFKIGGAQAIAALAYGTASVPQVYKIFGPGNQYVTAAKQLMSIDPQGAAIDMPAGPTEVLVVADATTRADFAASDLLAQAEHGVDSQAILVCTSVAKTKEILREVEQQLRILPRQSFAAKALANSFAVVVDNITQAMDFANRYAPEHLVLNVRQAARWVPAVRNAGSVFLGQFACESAGDYASGTNHSLPTYGYARVSGGVAVRSFQKQITFQQITAAGARRIGPIVATMAEQESLAGHQRAMQRRYQSTRV